MERMKVQGTISTNQLMISSIRKTPAGCSVKNRIDHTGLSGLYRSTGLYLTGVPSLSAEVVIENGGLLPHS